MAQFNIGEIIKDTRVRLGYSQEDLCFCDMELSTISRIERGDHIPQNSVIKKIFAQMNMRVPINAVYVNDEEFNQYQLHSEIQEFLDNNESNFEFEKIEKTLEDFKNCNCKMDSFDWQIYFLAKGVLSEKKHDFTFAKECFSKALIKTIPDFTDFYDFTKKHIVRNEELNCLYELAIAEMQLGNVSVSEYYSLFIFDYAEKGILDEQKRDVLKNKCLFQLCQLYDELKNSEKEIEYSEKGIKFCMQKDSLFHLSDFFYFKGRAFALKKDFISAENAFSVCFTLLKTLENIEELEKKEKAIKDDFDIDIKG